MKQKFLICQHCGNIIALIRDKGVPIYCCGEEMRETIDGSFQIRSEKIYLQFFVGEKYFFEVFCTLLTFFFRYPHSFGIFSLAMVVHL